MFSAFRVFSKDISVSAVHHVAVANTCKTRTIWLLIYLFFIGVTLYQCLGYLQQLNGDGVRTKVSFQALVVSNNKTNLTTVPTVTTVPTDVVKQRKKRAVTCAGWFYEQRHPNLCYYLINAANHTFQSAQDVCAAYSATLPIFRDLSEYISALIVWSGNQVYPCSTLVWLGIKYNTRLNSYTWLDNTLLTFNFYPSITDPNNTFIYNLAGSNWYSSSQGGVRCQKRLNESTPANPYQHPKSVACPPGDFWYYDRKSSICYYFDRYQTLLNWSDASVFCQKQSESSIPIFYNKTEHESYNKLTFDLQIGCRLQTWLGYVFENRTLMFANGTTAPFSNFATPPTNPGYVYSNGWAPNPLNIAITWNTDNGTSKYLFLCQYRPMNVTITNDTLQQGMNESDIVQQGANESVIVQQIANESYVVQKGANESDIVQQAVNVVGSLTVDEQHRLVVKIASVKDALSYVIANQPYITQVHLGYNYSEMFAQCTFNGRKCGREDFVMSVMPGMGNCYTFNHMNGTQYKTDRAGLKLILNPLMGDLLPSSITNGMAVFITSRNDTIFENLQTYTLPTSYIMDVALDYKVEERFGNCIEEKTSNYYFQGEYSAEGCYSSCSQNEMLRQCNCGYPMYPLPTSATNEYSYCSLAKKPCIDIVLNKTISCNCPPKCFDNIFVASTVYCKMKNRTAVYSGRKSLSAVNVYHRRMLYFSYEQDKAYQINDFYNDLSNVLGNNIDVAFHSLVEAIVLVCLLVAAVVGKII